MNMRPKKRSSDTVKGNHGKMFHAATTSMRQRLRSMGVTVARLENHLSPARICSKRMLGRTNSIVVVGWPWALSSL